MVLFLNIRIEANGGKPNGKGKGIGIALYKEYNDY